MVHVPNAFVEISLFSLHTNTLDSRPKKIPTMARGEGQMSKFLFPFFLHPALDKTSLNSAISPHWGLLEQKVLARLEIPSRADFGAFGLMKEDNRINMPRDGFL